MASRTNVNLSHLTSDELADKLITFYMKKIAMILSNTNSNSPHDVNTISTNRDIMFSENMLQKF